MERKGIDRSSRLLVARSSLMGYKFHLSSKKDNFQFENLRHGNCPDYDMKTAQK